MPSRRAFETLSCTVLSLLLALIAGSPAGADWLVTRDGARIETRGPWEVERDLLLFTTASGTFASIPAAEIDLEASVEATRGIAESARESPPPAPPSRPAAVKITESDLARWPTESRRPAPSGEVTEGTDPSPAAERLIVTEWDEIDQQHGLGITGTIANVSPEITGAVRLTAHFLGREGERLASHPAALTATTLQPGQKAGFRVSAAGTWTFDAIEFEIDHLALETAKNEEERVGGDAGAGPPAGR